MERKLLKPNFLSSAVLMTQAHIQTKNLPRRVSRFSKSASSTVYLRCFL